MRAAAALRAQTLLACVSGERDAVRGRALRLLLPGGVARDSAAASAAFAMVAEALRAGELVASDTDVYGRALAMCGPSNPHGGACCMDWTWYIRMHCCVKARMSACADGA